MNTVPEHDSIVSKEGSTIGRIVVTTQAELDQALSDGVKFIDIRSEPGVWLTVEDTGSSTVHVVGHSFVGVSESATVEAWHSATVTASDSATVHAWDSVTVKALGSATVTAWDYSTVDAWGYSTVEAWESASVRARGSSSISARGFTTVKAWGSATVEARSYVSVEAWGCSTVKAWGSSTVKASDRVAVHQHSRHVSISGGIVIDHTQEPLDPVEWCAWHNVHVTDGKALLYKAVGDDWVTESLYDYRPVYAPGEVLVAPDWEDDNRCGGGLHFSPRTWEACSYYPDATRFVAVEVNVVDLRPILGATPKAKAPRCRVLYEVDVDGKPQGDGSVE